MNFTAQNPHMPALPRSNIHLDILEGRDEILDVADFFSELFLLRYLLYLDLIHSHLQTLNLTRLPTFTQRWSGSCECDSL